MEKAFFVSSRSELYVYCFLSRSLPPHILFAEIKLGSTDPRLNMRIVWSSCIINI